MSKLKNITVAVCVCTMVVLATACGQANQGKQGAPSVETTELFRTSQSWDGAELPDYFTGRPELVAMKYVFPAVLYMFYLAQKDMPLSIPDEVKE